MEEHLSESILFMRTLLCLSLYPLSLIPLYICMFLFICLTGRLSDWLNGWLTGCWTGLLTGWLGNWLAGRLFDWLIVSPPILSNPSLFHTSCYPSPLLLIHIPSVDPDRAHLQPQQTHTHATHRDTDYIYIYIYRDRERETERATERETEFQPQQHQYYILLVAALPAHSHTHKCLLCKTVV